MQRRKVHKRSVAGASNAQYGEQSTILNIVNMQVVVIPSLRQGTPSLSCGAPLSLIAQATVASKNLPI